MRELITNRTLLVSILAISFFWVLAYFSPFYELNEIIGGILICVGIIVVFVYGTISWSAIKAESGKLDRLGQLAVGITVTWIGVLVHRAYHLWWRVEGQPLDMVNNHFVTFLIYITVLGGALHITAPSAASEPMPRQNIYLLLIAVIVGAMGAGFIIGAQWSGLFGQHPG